MKEIKDIEKYHNFAKEIVEKVDGRYTTGFERRGMADEKDILEYFEFMFKLFKLDRYYKDYLIIIIERVRFKDEQKEIEKMYGKEENPKEGKYYIEIMKHIYDKEKGKYIPIIWHPEFFVKPYEFEDKILNLKEDPHGERTYSYARNDVDFDFLINLLLQSNIKKVIPANVVNEERREVNIEEFKKYVRIDEFKVGSKFEIEVKEEKVLYKCRVLQMERLVKNNISFDVKILVKVIEDRKEMSKWTLRERGFFFSELTGLYIKDEENPVIPWGIIFGGEYDKMFVGLYNVYMNYKYDKEKYQYFFDYLAEECPENKLKEKEEKVLRYLVNILLDPEFRIFTKPYYDHHSELSFFFSEYYEEAGFDRFRKVQVYDVSSFKRAYIKGYGKFKDSVENLT